MALDRWIGTPYTAANCWALCVQVYREELGIFLGDYNRVADGDARIPEYVRLERETSGWVEVDLGSVRPLDLLELNLIEGRFHVGIAASAREVLTTMRGMGAMIVEWVNGRRRSHHQMRAVRAWRHPRC